MSKKQVAKAMGAEMTRQAKLMLQNCPSPRVRELVSTGLALGPAGASTQTLIQMAAPILAEMGVEFAISNMHNTEDPDAMHEAHKWGREIVGHAVKIGVIETMNEADEKQREHEMAAFERLAEIAETANKSGLRLDQALKGAGGIVDAEIVTEE